MSALTELLRVAREAYHIKEAAAQAHFKASCAESEAQAKLNRAAQELEDAEAELLLAVSTQVRS